MHRECAGLVFSAPKTLLALGEPWGYAYVMVKQWEGCWGPFGTPGSECLEEQAVKGLGWCIGNVLGWCSVLLKGFRHLESLGDMRKSW